MQTVTRPHRHHCEQERLWRFCPSSVSPPNTPGCSCAKPTTPASPISDTARSYPTARRKWAWPFPACGGNIIIATKTPSTTVEGFWQDLETSLRLLKTDYIDVYQFHNPAFCPKPGDGTGLYEAMEEAKRQGRSGLSASPTTGWAWRRGRRLWPV